jgi:two-component system, chemotaxis family, response regulator Rcp1
MRSELSPIARKAAERNVRPLEILLIEDNAGDIRLTQEALEEGKIWNHLSVVQDGLEAMAYLRREGKHSDDAKRPDLILLDLNLPKKDGREVLSEIKADPRLRQIPVIVLTATGKEENLAKAYGFQAHCYIPKPVDFDRFVSVVKSIEEFWFTVVKLRTKAGHDKSRD